jgi:ABC-2 type transport system ATP-binding protein
MTPAGARDAPAEIIRLDRVSRTFRGRTAVDAVSLTVHRGEILALLGPNGAGKSTTLALVLGLLRPTSGEVRIRGVPLGRDRAEARRGIGAVLETPAFHEYLTGWENLCLLASYSSEPEPAEILDTVRFVGLEDRIHDRVRGYSHGMRQRLALAQALVPAPDVVLLDEPAEGLDPVAIAAMHRLIRDLNREREVTVVIASHLLTELEEICDRVAVLDRGRLVFEGRWDDAGAEPRRVRLRTDDWERAVPALRCAGAIAAGEGVVELPSGVATADVVAALVREGLRIDAVEPIARTLADVYREAIAGARGDRG